MREIERIKKNIKELSVEVLDQILYECGIEIIRPSINSSYIKCLRSNLLSKQYRKEVYKYGIKEEYFDMDTVEQGAA